MAHTYKELEEESLSPAASTARRVRIAIEQRLWTRVSLGDIARQIGASSSTLSHSFRKHFGESPYQYAKRRRLLRASFYLRFSKASITDIALGSGFDSLEGFTRAFKSRFGHSPREHRKRSQREVKKSHRPALEAQIARVVLEPVHLAAIRCEGHAEYRWLPQWIRLFRWASSKGFLTAQTRYFWLAYEAQEGDDAQEIHDIAISVPSSCSLGLGMDSVVLCGPYAALECTGSLYEHGLIADWMAYQWLPHSGLHLRRFEGHSEVLVGPEFHRHPLKGLMRNLKTSRCVHRLPVTHSYAASDLQISEGPCLQEIPREH